MRTLPVSNEFVRFNNAFRADEETAKTSVSDIVEANKKEAKPNKTGQIVTSALAIAALVGSGIAIARNPKKSGEVVDKAKDTALNDLMKKLKEMENKLNKLGENEEAKALREEINNLQHKLDEKANWFDGYNKGTTEKVNELSGKIDVLFANMPEGSIERGMMQIDGLTLMQNMKTDKAIPLEKEQIKYLQTISRKYQNGEVSINTLRKGNSIWGISTETKWRGTGGQGEIFTQQAKNFKKAGVTEYEILGGNEVAGLGGIHGIDGRYMCTYKNTKIDIEKVVEFPMDVYHGGRHSIERVTVFTGIDPMTEQPMLIFENPKYFSSNDFIYGNSAGGITERSEPYASPL